MTETLSDSFKESLKEIRHEIETLILRKAKELPEDAGVDFDTAIKQRGWEAEAYEDILVGLPQKILIDAILAEAEED